MPIGNLYLLPVPIGTEDLKRILPDFNQEIVKSLQYFIVENAKNARKFLKLCGYPIISNANIEELNEHTSSKDYSLLLEPLFSGNSVGLMSDAGCPGIADPGAEVIKIAHQKGIKIVPLVGPSSIVLSIMASGFNGQNFAFNGYLPVDKVARSKRIKELELHTEKYRQAQFFIETPYRNQQLFNDLLLQLKKTTRLFIGINLTTSNEIVATKSISEWVKSDKPEFNKIPTVFGIYTD